MSVIFLNTDYQTILFFKQFSLTYHLFALILNIEQFYSTDWSNTFRCNHSRLDWTGERWQWRGTPDFLKLQYYWGLTIRLFSGISWIFEGKSGLTPLQRSSWCWWLTMVNGTWTAFLESRSISMVFFNHSQKNIHQKFISNLFFFSLYIYIYIYIYTYGVLTIRYNFE